MSRHLFFKVYGIHFSRKVKEGNTPAVRAFPDFVLLVHSFIPRTLQICRCQVARILATHN